MVARALRRSMLGLRPHARRLADIGFPDPGGRFHGYDVLQARSMDGALVPSTRPMVSLACRAANMLLADTTGMIACTKRESVGLYASSVGDTWAQLVEQIYLRRNLDWRYTVPDDAASQKELASLCRDLLGLERHAARGRSFVE